MTPCEVLALSLAANDAGATTVREYLRLLLVELWWQEDGFTGKRPFGHTGWQEDLARALVRAGVVQGRVDRHGALDGYDRQECKRVIAAAIDEMCKEQRA